MSSARAGAGGSSVRMSPTRLVDSAWLQGLGVVCATLAIALLHWDNDGLWFQGDAPRHAVTGLLFRDLLATWPAQPLDFALGYFARYPALVLGAYPPLFHLVEGAGFLVFGTSPYVAKALVLVGTVALGGFTAAWGRRSIAPLAGWAGPCVVLTPIVVELSNAVLLNVPSAALGVAALYYGQIWLENPRTSARWRLAGFGAAATATYLPGAIVLPMAGAWVVMSGAFARLRAIWLPALLLVAAVAATAVVLPDHFARQGPGLSRLFDGDGWTYYGTVVPRRIGRAWSLLALAGLVLGVATPRLRTATIRLAVALGVGLVCLVVLPARDLRYGTIGAPLVVLLAFVALVRLVELLRPRWQATAASLCLVGLLALGWRGAAATPLTHIEGIDGVAAYLRDHGPTDSVLYSGVYDGVFTFYVRHFDPRFERRVVLANRFLAELRQGADFEWRETLKVSAAADVAPRLRAECGCRFVAIERGGDWITAADRLLADAVTGPDFTLVRSFPVRAGAVSRVDVYRVTGEVAPAPVMDLSFPSFSARVFRAVAPVATRR